ncbi:chemotaxis protein CheW [Ekhidna sp.]|jgi:purine-binding chemotaxis protein CheW|uniref:chemotaxis protein CheW n=1 Tax=Ekhidna sp. TaxID=2608089 RepID=UPI0032EF1F0D
MALGKNLKRKKLISEEPKENEPKKVKKKSLIKKDAPKKAAKPSKKSSTRKDSSTKAKKKKVSTTKPAKKVSTKQKKQKPESIQPFDPVLSNYIANELRERKIRLRKQYATEISELQDKNIQLVSFIINNEIYATDIHIIKEVVKFPAISKTPNTPKHISGLANVRGTSYVVFDLAARFGIESVSEPNYLMIFNHHEIKASLVLESLPTTLKVEGKSISSDIQMIEDATLDLSYIKGVIHLEEKLVYYLDIIEMLKNDKAVVIPDELKN